MHSFSGLQLYLSRHLLFLVKGPGNTGAWKIISLVASFSLNPPNSDDNEKNFTLKKKILLKV